MKQSNSNTALTVLTIVVGLTILNYFMQNDMLLLVIIAIGVLGVLSSWIRDSIHFIWMKLADLLGLIIPKLILSLIFYLIVTPLGMLSRIFSPNELLIKKNDRNSFFLPINRKFDKSFFEKPW